MSYHSDPKVKPDYMLSIYLHFSLVYNMITLSIRHTCVTQRQMTQIPLTSHIWFIYLQFWKDHKYCQMHISSDSESFSSSTCAFWLEPHSSVLRGSERQDAHTLTSFKSLSSSPTFVSIFNDIKSAFFNMLHSNISPYTWYIWPTGTVCINHTHTYILSL